MLEPGGKRVLNRCSGREVRPGCSNLDFAALSRHNNNPKDILDPWKDIFRAFLRQSHKKMAVSKYRAVVPHEMFMLYSDTLNALVDF